MLLLAGFQTADAVEFRGVNISGADFGDIKNTAKSDTPFGVSGRHYHWPDSKNFHYWIREIGADTIRLPFRWERVQPDLNAPPDLGELQRSVLAATSLGATVIIDVHNYGNRWVKTPDGVKQAQIDAPSGLVTREQFASLWGSIAKAFAANAAVQFDLMNEPHDMRAADSVSEAVQVARFYQAAIDAIRAAGASNVIHVEPPNWAKAKALVGSFSSAALELKDPQDRLIFQVHQYLDNGEDGTDPSLIGNNVHIGAEKLGPVTEWARTHKKKLFLGEFGIPAVPEAAPSREAAANMIDFVEANPDVWIGWTAWGAGRHWNPKYPFRLEPSDSGNPALDVLGPRLKP
ncbi:cellulase [Terrihabitans soli]|uniref:Cellulase n=1 Tax=Terrihabitans soli TaxID=708113 RepID=A0A6S6QXD5_9HYPH|nr:glycoside hydrolase family 5 protein [Terrihabitans soli]BCJ91932.1 cellulase [Terrihabitans soli]